MPPVTRRSQYGGNGIGRKAPSRKPRNTALSRTPSDSWELVARETDRTNGVEEQSEQNITADSRSERDQSRTYLSTEHDMDELRETAARVGKQAEFFAETLDDFLDGLDKRDKFESVLHLVKEFSNIAQDAAHQLAQTSERDRAQQLCQEWALRTDISAGLTSVAVSSIEGRDSGLSRNRAEQVKQLQRWQQEADIWDLVHLILEEYHNPDRIAVRQQKQDAKEALGNVHMYTPESQIWERFLLDDDVARERSKVKAWLEQSADHQQSNLEDIVEELERRAGRGKGFWSQGWMHTRETIKSEKRMRTWPSAEESPLAQVKRSDNNELLVTTLDPDAPVRQGRTLEKPDAYFERAMWITVWEMLRRGKPWHDVRKWCREQQEGWRAVSIGMGGDSKTVTSRAAWRKMCLLASQSGCLGDFEGAIYGLLGGNAQAVQKVCRTVDDHLFAFYSSFLVRRFDQYMAKNYPNRAPLSREGPADDAQDPDAEISRLITRLRTEPNTAEESIQPLKMIQSYLLANEIGSMIQTVGFAVAEHHRRLQTGDGMIIRLNPFWEGENNLAEEEIVVDPQALRIVTHISILMSVLRADISLDIDELSAEENVTAAYILELRTSGKRTLIPTYASRLQKGRYVIALSRVLPDVTSAEDREAILLLIKSRRLDVVEILREQVAYSVNQALVSGSNPSRPLSMLEPAEDQKTYPGQRIIADFLSEHISEEEEAIVRSLQWYYILSEHWRETFGELAFALRRALAAGRIACAMSIVDELSYEKVCLRKSEEILGRPVNIMDLDNTPARHEVEQWTQMMETSKTYYQLECIVTAIKALSQWRDAEYAATSANLKSSQIVADLRAAKEEVDYAIAFILKDHILQNLSGDDDEIESLDSIRTTYIPELVLAYNTVLHSAGSLISRDTLLESMDLSIMVADEANGISECFVRAGRMRELVSSFAQTSKLMLLLKELGGPRKSGKKDREGKDLGMWEIGPQGGHERSTSFEDGDRAMPLR